MFAKLHRLPATALLVSSLFVLSACDDDPVGAEDDHSEPVGMVVSLGGVDIVTVNGSTVTGTLTVSAGQETAHIDIDFLDENGNRFAPDEADEWLRVTIADPATATWEQDEPGEFGGHLQGRAAGATVARFDIMHGALNSASAHADYTSPDIPVVIN
jgi:hypothetical protein